MSLKLRPAYIDLTRHLPDLKASLAPTPSRAFHPIWLAQAVGDIQPAPAPGRSFARTALQAFLLWLILVTTIIALAWLSSQK